MATGPDKAHPEEQAAAAPVAALKPFGPSPLRFFALEIALPALLLYIAGAALVIVVLVIMARDMDRLADTRGVAGMHAAVDSFLNDLGNSVADEGTWDEAYLNVVVTPSPAWMDSTWGDAARLGQSYDAVFVTDTEGAIQFAEDSVGSISGNIADRFHAARTMLIELDRRIAATGNATTISNFAADKSGLAGLAAISIHQSQGDGAVSRKARRILWIARHVTPGLLEEMTSRYQIPLASLVTLPEPDQSSIDLADADGRVAGTLAWTPDRPGDAAFTRALLIATAIYFAIGLAMVVGLGMIRRSLLRRAVAVQEAFDAVTRQSDIRPVLEVARKAIETIAPLETRHESIIDGVNAADFLIEYQPIFDLRAETLIGAEALLRWRRPDASLLLQEDLTADENATLLGRVGILAFRHAAHELAPFLGLRLTINVSAAQLMDDEFTDKVIGTLGATSFQASRLQLALNATRLPAVADLRQPLTTLRGLGVGIAFSDFVIGPATIDWVDPSLGDHVRLPKTMLTSVDDPARYALVEATLTLAKSVNWAVTVPFVERKEEAARLLRLGCREFQGKLFAEPMSVSALTALLLNPTTRKAG